jgi:predicted Zn-dependent peptidase
VSGRATPRPGLGPLRAVRNAGIVEESVGGGLHVLAARRAGIPMVELRLGFRLGADLIARPAPITVLSESILAGTARHDRSGLASAVQRIGGSLDASTHGDWILLSGSVLAEHLSEMLEIVADVLSAASYPSSEVAADRGRMAEEVLIDLSRPELLAEQELRRRLYPGHPYASGLPSPDALAHVSAARLRRAHAEALAPAVGHLVLVGDLAPKRAISAAARTLEPWLSGSHADPVLPLAPLPAVRLGPLQLFDRPGAFQSNIRLARLAPGRQDPLWPATTLANLIFGGLFASRLVENLRERHGFTYSPRAAIHHHRAGSSFVLEADVATATTAASLIEISYELGRIATQGVTEQEHESAVRYALGTLAFQTATQAGLASTLVGLAVMGLDPGYLARHGSALKRTKQREVDEAARRLFAPSRMITLVLGDAEAVGPSLGIVDEVQPRALSSRR